MHIKTILEKEIETKFPNVTILLSRSMGNSTYFLVSGENNGIQDFGSITATFDVKKGNVIDENIDWN